MVSLRGGDEPPFDAFERQRVARLHDRVLRLGDETRVGLLQELIDRRIGLDAGAVIQIVANRNAADSSPMAPMWSACQCDVTSASIWVMPAAVTAAMMRSASRFAAGPPLPVSINTASLDGVTNNVALPPSTSRM